MKTQFYDSLIDDFGIWQHTNGIEPLREEGYALDDATRGLVLSLALQRTRQANVLFDYIKKSFANDQVYGFATADRQFISAPASEDAIGQVAWAMGLACNRDFRVAEAKIIFNQAKGALKSPKYLRGPVYSLLGATLTDAAWADELAADIITRFEHTRRGWPWPEAYLTYGNGIVPYALLRYGQATNSQDAHILGLEILNFVDKACRLHHMLGPIGNRGWYSDNSGHPPVYSQQPIDTAYMVWACRAAYEATKQPYWEERAREWMAWFEGGNVTGSPVIDKETAKCFDGIDGPEHISRNSGAESNICYLLSRVAMEHNQLF